MNDRKAEPRWFRGVCIALLCVSACGDDAGGAAAKDGGTAGGGQLLRDGGGSNTSGDPGSDAGSNGQGGSDASEGGDASGGSSGGKVVITAAKADVKEAALVCAWAESCLKPEMPGVHDGAQPAPEPSMSRCIANYLTLATKGVSAAGVDPRPFDVLSACAHVAKACGDYQKCLFDQGVLNFCESASQNAPLCDGDIVRLPCASTKGISRAADCAASGRRCENGTCVGATCTYGAAPSCAEDGSFVRTCGADQHELNFDCHGQPCAIVGPQGLCLPAAIEACTVNGYSCDGTQQVACSAPTGYRFDCAKVGLVCQNGSCANPSPACYENHNDTCAGTVLTVCASGAEQAFDCASVGGTCGMLTSGKPGCVIK